MEEDKEACFQTPSKKHHHGDDGGDGHDRIKNINGNSSTDSKVCQICGKTFSSAKALGGHMRVHGLSSKKVVAVHQSNKNTDLNDSVTPPKGWSATGKRGRCAKADSDVPFGFDPRDFNGAKDLLFLSNSTPKIVLKFKEDNSKKLNVSYGCNGDDSDASKVKKNKNTSEKKKEEKDNKKMKSSELNTCNICNKSFSSCKTLSDHIKTHTKSEDIQVVNNDELAGSEKEITTKTTATMQVDGTNSVVDDTGRDKQQCNVSVFKHDFDLNQVPDMDEEEGVQFDSH